MSARREHERGPAPVWDEAAEAETEAPGEDPIEEPDYRRRRQPVRVRRRQGGDWTRRWGQAWHWSRNRGRKPVLITAATLGIAIGIGWGGNALLFHNPAFVLTGSDQITVSGTVHVDAAQVRRFFAADLGRDIFYIPLPARQQAIEALPWVRHAAVLRLWPAAIQVRIQERVPVAFARAGNALVLLDPGGVVLPLQGASDRYNFPVLEGVPGVTAAAPNTPARLAARQPAMQLYASLRAALDAGGGHGGQGWDDISEIDFSQPGDLIATVADPSNPGTTTLVHLGDGHFADRMNVFLAQIAGWRQKYPNMTSVDLHVDGEAIVDPGTAPPPAPAHAPASSQAAAHSSRRR